MISNETPEIIILQNSKEKPPYLLGVLCIIPIVGALVGIALVLLGIIKYRDKWISIIGVLGIGITLAAAYFFVDYFRNSKVMKQAYVNMSEANLNHLVKDIEFYKLQRGNYPDSLPQLLKTDKSSPVYEPLRVFKTRKRKLYTYKNSGNKYHLYSSGIDGIAGTGDDLFPTLVISDSNRVGLIIPVKSRQ